MSARTKQRRAIGLVFCVLVATFSFRLSDARAATAPLHFENWPSGDFGFVLLGQSTVQKFAVRNDGARRTGTLTVVKTGSGDFTIPARRNHCASKHYGGSNHAWGSIAKVIEL